MQRELNGILWKAPLKCKKKEKLFEKCGNCIIINKILYFVFSLQPFALLHLPCWVQNFQDSSRISFLRVYFRFSMLDASFEHLMVLIKTSMVPIFIIIIIFLTKTFSMLAAWVNPILLFITFLFFFFVYVCVRSTNKFEKYFSANQSFIDLFCCCCCYLCRVEFNLWINYVNKFQINIFCRLADSHSLSGWLKNII